MRYHTYGFLMTALAVGESGAAPDHETDLFDVQGCRLAVVCIGHGTLMFDYDGMIVHVDPVPAQSDYSRLPSADLILVTHEHQDHLAPALIDSILAPGGEIVANPSSQAKLGRGTALSNGSRATAKGIGIEAVPAYNTTPGRDKYHPKGRDNGYVLDFDGFRVYIAGDTEPIPEMRALGTIDVAFLPVNQPYTMTPAQAADAARQISPRVLYPYHYGDTNVAELARLLADDDRIEVRIRRLA